jgi:hypothetical protein
MERCSGVCVVVIVLDIVSCPIHQVRSHPVLSWRPDLYLTTRSSMFESSKHADMYISFA